MCCCCVCQCDDEQTREYKCCILFPIKCGVQFIALLTVLIAVCQFLEIFYQILNDNIDWWYVLVGVLLSVPLVVALAFAICFYNEETDSTRNLLYTGLILTIVSLTLGAAWNATYFWFFYKHNDVVTGNDGVGYTKATRKQEIVFSCYIALVADCFFAYFLCVMTNYIHAYREHAIVKKMKELADADEEAKALKENEDGGDAAAAPAKEENADGEKAESAKGSNKGDGEKPEGEAEGAAAGGDAEAAPAEGS